MVNEIRTLTYLRALAAWLVASFHFWHLFPAQHRFDIPLLEHGGVGVDIFFVLSGFVLTHVYETSFVRRTFRYRDFLVKRLARIYPVHLATLTAAIALAVAYSGYKEGHIGFSLLGQSPGVSGLMVMYQLLLLHSSGLIQTGFLDAPSWSISAEWFAYLLFPLLLGSVLRFRARPLVLLIAIVSGGAIAELAIFRLFGRTFFDLGSEGGALRILPCFVLGILICVSPFRSSVVLRHPALCAAVALAALAVLLPLNFQFLCLLPIALGIAALRDLDSRIDHAEPIARSLGYLGHISYSTYMVHFFALFLVAPVVKASNFHVGSVMLILLLYTLLTLIFAAVSYHLVEVPFRRMLVDGYASYLQRLSAVD